MEPEDYVNLGQCGRIVFAGQLATKFWVRTLGLEKEVEEARALMGARIERKWGAKIPIVAEYEVEPDFKWIYLIVVNVDILGIRDGMGVVYFASRAFEEEIMQARDAQAKELLDGMEKRHPFDEVVVLPEKKER